MKRLSRQLRLSRHLVALVLLYLTQDMALQPKEKIGEIGFEPTTSCSQGRRANQAAPLPVLIRS